MVSLSSVLEGSVGTKGAHTHHCFPLFSAMASCIGQGVGRSDAFRPKISTRRKKVPVCCSANLESASAVSRRGALESLAAGGASLILPQGSRNCGR